MNRVTVAVAIVSGILAVAPVHAAVVVDPNGTVLNTNNRNNNRNNNNRPLTAAQQKQLAAQQAADAAAIAAAKAKAAAVAVAEAKVADAQKAFDDVVNKQTLEFKQSPDYTAAKASVATESAAYEQVKVPVIAALPASNATYRAAAQKLAAAKAEYASLQSGDSRAVSIGMSQSIFELGNIMGPIEQAAVEADPGCIAAKKKLDDAMAAVEKLESDFRVALQKNPDWTAAKAALDKAVADLAAAKAK